MRCDLALIYGYLSSFLQRGRINTISSLRELMVTFLKDGRLDVRKIE